MKTVKYKSSSSESEFDDEEDPDMTEVPGNVFFDALLVVRI